MNVVIFPERGRDFAYHMRPAPHDIPLLTCVIQLPPHRRCHNFDSDQLDLSIRIIPFELLAVGAWGIWHALPLSIDQSETNGHDDSLFPEV